MRELIEVPSAPRRPPVVLVGVVLLGALLLGGGRLLSYYVEALWFGSLGYTEVFRRALGLEWGFFAFFLVLTFALLFGSYLLLRDSGPGGGIHLVRSVLVNGQTMTVDMGRWLKPAVLLGSLLAAFIAASTLSSEWPTFARWLYAPHGASVADPVLGRPLNFYLLTLPAWQLLAGWLTAMSVLVLALAIGLHVLHSRPQGENYPFAEMRNGRWGGVYGAAAFFLATLALHAWLARFGLLLEEHTIFSGVTYTDEHVELPGLMLVAFALLLGALFLVYCAVQRSGARWIAVAALPGVLLYVGVQVAGAAVNTFIVKPNELVKEQPYIRNNIAATRTAYALDDIVVRPFAAGTNGGRCGGEKQPADAAEYPAVGHAGASGHAAADPGDSDLL